MSAIKRIIEDMIENEDEIASLIDLAKNKNPKLYNAVKIQPNLIKCALMFSKFTKNEQLIRLASFYLVQNCR